MGLLFLLLFLAVFLNQQQTITVNKVNGAAHHRFDLEEKSTSIEQSFSVLCVGIFERKLDVDDISHLNNLNQSSL